MELSQTTNRQAKQEPEMNTTQIPAHNAVQQIEPLLERIALDHLFIETLATRHSDRLDFHDVSVWAVKSALLAAYQAGMAASHSAAAHAAGLASSQPSA